jgi:AAA domain
MKLLFLYGLPGTGKLTIARELAGLTRYKLFHNHLAVDLLLSVFEFGSTPFVELRESIWLSVFEEAAAIPLPALIFTFNPENSVQQSFIENMMRIISSFDGKVLFIEVTCDPAELERRIDTPQRRNHKKLVSLELFRQLKSEGIFDSPKLPEPHLTIDSTSVPPLENAQKIVERFSLPVLGQLDSSS